VNIAPYTTQGLIIDDKELKSEGGNLQKDVCLPTAEQPCATTNAADTTPHQNSAASFQINPIPSTSIHQPIVNSTTPLQSYPTSYFKDTQPSAMLASATIAAPESVPISTNGVRVPSVVPSYKCNQCLKEYTQKQSLARHIKIIHVKKTLVATSPQSEMSQVTSTHITSGKSRKQKSELQKDTQAAVCSSQPTSTISQSTSTKLQQSSHHDHEMIKQSKVHLCANPSIPLVVKQYEKIVQNTPSLRLIHDNEYVNGLFPDNWFVDTQLLPPSWLESCKNVWHGPIDKYIQKF
jgi:hypothetical protein